MHLTSGRGLLYDVGISLPWSRCCSTDGMWGMRVCEWTRRELTLDIRFTGGDYDPGRSGRKREKKTSKAKASGRGKRRETQGRGRANGAKAMKWNEVFDLPGTGQVLLAECLIWCRACERMDTTGCTEHLLWPRIMEKETAARCGPCIYLSRRHPFFVRPTSVWTFSHFPLQNSWSDLEISPESTLFVRKFSLRGAWFYSRGLCCIFKWPFLFFPLF